MYSLGNNKGGAASPIIYLEDEVPTTEGSGIYVLPPTPQSSFSPATPKTTTGNIDVVVPMDDDDELMKLMPLPTSPSSSSTFSPIFYETSSLPLPEISEYPLDIRQPNISPNTTTATTSSIPNNTTTSSINIPRSPAISFQMTPTGVVPQSTPFYYPTDITNTNSNNTTTTSNTNNTTNTATTSPTTNDDDMDTLEFDRRMTLSPTPPHESSDDGAEFTFNTDALVAHTPTDAPNALLDNSIGGVDATTSEQPFDIDSIIEYFNTGE